MTDRPDDVHGRLRFRTKIVRVPPVLALVLALPVVLVAGAVAVATFAAGVVGLLLAPARARRRQRQGAADGGVTITLDPSAYQTVPGDASRGDRRPLRLAARDPSPRS
jgi:hypothetical protein